ncbi:MAG: glycosyltransferase family 2 protein [Anaerolineaceae bacterium]|nr:glycosyltransferase family 2 protein [Anaerolineaceae bacterium]
MKKPIYTFDVSLVIPVYNEVESLPLLHKKITQVMTENDYSWEVIYIDDGSDDGSTHWLEDLSEHDEHVVVAIQRRNFGKAVALTTGFALTRGRFIATLDSDLQDEPNEIPRLFAELEDGYDIVTGWKETRKDPLSKRIPSKIANGFTSLMTGLRLNDMNSGLKAYRANCAKSLRLYGDLHRYVPVIAYLNGYKVSELPVVHHERRFGHSKYGPGRLIRGGLDLITVLFLSKFSTRPLHLFGPLGGALFGIGLFINLVLALEWLGGDRGLHERPLLTLGVLLTLMGLQLLTMGLIAELVVSFMQRQDNPLNTLRDVYRYDDETIAVIHQPSAKPEKAEPQPHA